MEWTSNQIITLVISTAALLLGIANFINTRILANKEQARKRRDDELNAERFLDSAYDLLYGEEGYTITKKSTKFSEAASLIEQAVKIEPNNPRVIEYQGHLFEVQGNIQSAISRYEKSISINPNRARPYLWLGIAIFDEKSIKHFEKAIELEPEKADRAYFNLGRLYKKLGNTKEAENCLRAAIKLSPVFEAAQAELGEILREQGNFDEARLCYETAISANPRYIDAMVSLGRLLMDNQQDEEALSWFEQAMKVNPANDYPLAMLAAIYADRKEPEKSLPYATRAIELNPTRRFKTDSFIELIDEMHQLLEERNTSE